MARVREVWQYRRILSFFAVRAVQSLYRKTYLGAWWLFIRTLVPLLIGAFVFGEVIDVPSGNVPYLVFFLAGQLPWNFFDGPLVRASRAIDSNRQLLTKLYIPRIVLPLGQMTAGVVEPVIIAAILAVTLVYVPLGGRRLVRPAGTTRGGGIRGGVRDSLVCVRGIALHVGVAGARPRHAVRAAARRGVLGVSYPGVYPASAVLVRYRWLIDPTP